MTGRSRPAGEAFRAGAASGDRGPVLLDAEYEPAADSVGLDKPYRDFVSEAEGPTRPPSHQPLRSFVTVVVIAGQCRDRDEPIGSARRQGDEQAELGDASDAADKH